MMQELSSIQSEPTSGPVLAGIDVGGTFTDFVLFDGADLTIHKVPTTPDDQSRAIVAGLAELSVTEAEILHGMTVATNALLERKGARTGLLTTEGFADVLVIGRQNRPQIYALHQERPAALVADELRFECRERLDSTGAVVTPLDEAAAARIAARIADLHAAGTLESLAVSFLFSFRHPRHEELIAAHLRAAAPELPLSLSAEILPEYREYERTSTTVINAYVQPLVARYLARLDDALPASSVRIMQSNGGIIGLDQAAAQAARVVLSGPAGGVVGAFALTAETTGTTAPNIVTFDMGGTSTDVALCPGSIPATSESTITDLPLRLPVIDIHTVGAGGGSIAHVDTGGGLRVGPASAGAVPGPVCYGRGGVEPTVTDANLVLGRLDADGFLGGRGAVSLDADAAYAALAELGRALHLTPEEAALGVIRVANATMERALRRVSVERGHDPREFTLVPFGGAGPLHACDLAAALGIPAVLLPLTPGVLSAYGMLVADVVHDVSHSVLETIDALIDQPAQLQRIFASQETRVRKVFTAEGITKPAIDAALDLRYQGQSYELTVPLALPLDQEGLRRAATEFHTLHAQRYGYAMEDETIEAVTLRVRATEPGARPKMPVEPLVSADASAARLTEKPVWFDEDGAVETPYYDRAKLQPGNRFAGPAVVFQFDTTTVVPPGWHGRVDEYRNLWLEERPHG